MESNNIAKKTALGLIWKFMERIAAQLVSLVVSVVIARILGPDDYSVVSIVAIFFTFANILISGGLNTALIQKKNADEEDYSSVLVISVAVSAGIYLALFFCAPVLANLYEQPILVPVTRVMSLTLLITAVKGVWCAYISSNMQFKKFFFATIGGTIFSAVVGIVMAVLGFGPWALVAQQMTNTIIDTVILIITTPIHIKLHIHWKKVRALFRYSWKVFVSSIISVVYTEINPMVIGLKYGSADLAYYTKGRSFPTLFSTTMVSTFSAVLFPALSKNQDDKDILLKQTRMFIRLSSYVMFPIMLGLYAIADNFVLVILSEKWLPVVPYIKIFCVYCMFNMIHSGNCETIKAMGRSDIFLIMEIIKKTCYFVIIALFVWLGDSPESVAVSFIVCSVVAMIVNSIPNRKLIGYKFSYQCYDLMINLGTAIFMSFVVFLVGLLPIDALYLLIIQIATGVVVYILTSIITRNNSIIYLWNFVRKSLKGNVQND